MRIRIIGGSRLVAPDGFRVVRWADGSEHDVTDEIGASLIRDQWAVPATATAAGPSETQATGPTETTGARRRDRKRR